MLHGLTSDQMGQLLALFGGIYTIDALGGRVRTLARPLPGDAVCAILPPCGDGVTRVVCDLSKPDALAHTREMLGRLFESYAEPVAFPDGSVELVSRPRPQPSSEPLDLIAAV